MDAIQISCSSLGSTKKQLPSQVNRDFVGPSKFGKFGRGCFTLAQKLYLYSLGRQDVLAAFALRDA